MQPTQTIQAVKSLPEELRLWLASDATREEVKKINTELDLQEDETRLIPHLLFRLTVKDLEPQHFVETLSDWLDISPSSANVIAKEIKERVLAPVAGPLRSSGIEINLIQPTTIETRPFIVAPPPPTLPPLAKPEAPLPPPPPRLPIEIKPPPAYEPPPPPPMGGRMEMGGAGAAGGVGESVHKGRVHTIGEAHEHAREENKELGITNKEYGAKPQPTEQKEEKKIKLPIPQAEERGEDKPFMLHKETALLPVSKEQEWKPPAQPTTIGNQKSPLLPKPGLRVVHYDEQTTPVGRIEKQEARIKRGVEPKPQGAEIKGNMVDLR